MYTLYFCESSEIEMNGKMPTRNVFCLFLICCLLAVVCGLNAQPSVFKADPDGAKEFFTKKNYAAAIKVYTLLLKKEPNNIEYNQRIAQCYLLSN